MRIAITGTIGSGKSMVSELVRKSGYPVYDADMIAHKLYEPGEPTYEYLLNRYGPEILNRDATINRSILAEHLFSKDENIMDLENRIFPEVMDCIDAIYAKSLDDFVFFEVSMLYEAQLESEFDEVWVVDAGDAIRHQRLIDRGMSESEIEKREARQIARNIKLNLADRIIDNNGSIEVLKKNVDEALERISE